MSAIVVAIDGPSGVGKSTVSRLLASMLGARYIDTGAMYRAVAIGAYGSGIKAQESAELENFLSVMDFSFKGDSVFLNGVDLTERIREAQAGMLASKYSSLSSIRRRLVGMQREYAASGSIVMEGRDITTVVLPDADFKFFLTASPEVRAKRRLTDEKSTIGRTLEEVASDIKARDERDRARADSPLAVAEDALTIDTGVLSIDGVVEMMMILINEKSL